MSFLTTLQAKVRARTTFKGHLHTYRFCDNVRLRPPGQPLRALTSSLCEGCLCKGCTLPH